MKSFSQTLAANGWPVLRPATLEIFQVNLGKLCNMTCRHCHVDAGPHQTDKMMDRQTLDLCLAALDRTSAHTVDITGGAPELHPDFCYLVEQARARQKHVIDRCNLTVLLVPKYQHLPQWLADHEVELVCSLPHFRRRFTDVQRGDGTFEKSIEALKRLNAVGYGQGDLRRQLCLMSNPVGAYLAGNQTSLERDWKQALWRDYGITFDRFYVLNNMPIARFLDWLRESDNYTSYMKRLVSSFNPATVVGLMCKNTISVSWDGRVYDCDFNQMLDLPSEGVAHVRDFVATSRTIVTGNHCFGCTAGTGSSCGGALAAE